MTAAPSPVLPNAAGSRKSVAFVVVCVVLIAAAVTLNTVVPKFKITFRKQAVEPAAPLKSIKADLGPWAQVSVDRALSPDIEHELGATYYLNRDYLDTRKLKPDDRRRLLAATLEEREKMRGTIKDMDASMLVRFALTYYTGAVDTVPHVPDRCYVADGQAISQYQVVKWPVLPRKADAARGVELRLLNFENAVSSSQTQPIQVAYFFQVNGHYESDPVFGVRKRLQNLFDRQAYFSKIELRTDLPDGRAAPGVMTDFLQQAMPEIERVLPQWVQQD